MFLEILKYSLVMLVLPLALSFGYEYIKYFFKKKEKALENKVEKPTLNINNLNVTNIYYNNNHELPK